MPNSTVSQEAAGPPSLSILLATPSACCSGGTPHSSRLAGCCDSRHQPCNPLVARYSKERKRMSNVYYTGYRLYDFQEIYEKFQKAGAKEHLRHDSKSKDLEKSTSLYLHGPFDIDTDLNERSRKWREGPGYVMDVIASHYGRKVADSMFDKVSPLTRRPLRDEITRGDLDALRTELKKHQPLPVMLLQDYEHVKSGPISDALIS